MNKSGPGDFLGGVTLTGGDLMTLLAGAETGTGAGAGTAYSLQSSPLFSPRGNRLASKAASLNSLLFLSGGLTTALAGECAVCLCLLSLPPDPHIPSLNLLLPRRTRKT